MSLFHDLITCELYFPGATNGATEINCPHCSELPTVSVNDPMGEEAYQCCECDGTFDGRQCSLISEAQNGNYRFGDQTERLRHAETQQRRHNQRRGDLIGTCSHPTLFCDLISEKNDPSSNGLPTSLPIDV